MPLRTNVVLLIASVKTKESTIVVMSNVLDFQTQDLYFAKYAFDDHSVVSTTCFNPYNPSGWLTSTNTT